MTGANHFQNLAFSEDDSQRIFGLPVQELAEKVETHTFAVQAWLASRSPQAEILKLDGVRCSSTGYKIPFLNLALGGNFERGLSEREIIDEIARVKNFFQTRNIPWYWWMSAHPSPSHLSDILASHGLEFDHHPLPAMAASLSAQASFPNYPANIKVWRANSMDDLRAASTIRRTAFRFPEGEAVSYFELMAPDWLKNPQVRLFLAGEDFSTPVSIGALIMGAGMPGVYVMATLPGHHRQGYGKAILTRLLEEAAAGGHSLLILTASRAGFGLYSQFGFQHILDFHFYSPTPAIPNLKPQT